jgi:membrane protein
MLAYYTFMSFIPLLLALVLLGSRVISTDTAIMMLENLIGQILPQSKELVLREVTGLAEQKAWSMVSIVVLFWWMVPVASVLRETCASIFKTSVSVFRSWGPRPVSFVLGKLYDMGSLLLIVTLMAVLTGTGWVYNLADRLLGVHVPMLRTLMDYGVPNLAAFLCLFIFYMLFVPDRRHPLAIVVGTIVTAVLLKLMNPIFTLMLQFNPDYGYMFGSLKAIFLFFVWIYYASFSILVGAEVMSCLIRRRELVLGDQVKRLLSGDDTKPRYRFLVRSYTRPMRRGDILFTQGEAGEDMFVVARGRMAMVRNGETVALMEKGRCFGEVGALLGIPRTATARVESEEAEVVALSPAHLSNPDLLIKLLQDMASRLVRNETGGLKSKLPVDLS